MTTINTSKQKKLSKETILAFCDFESLLYDNKHYPCCFAISIQNKICTDHISFSKHDNIDAICSKLMLSFINKCCEIVKLYKKKRILFFFHNLSKFDSFFLIKYCINLNITHINIINNDSILYKIQIKHNKIKLEFRDSFLLLPISLEQIGNSFCNKYKKLQFDHTLNTYELLLQKDLYFINNLINYCKNDVLTLEEGFINYLKIINKNFNFEPLNSLSISSLAFNLYKTNYYQNTKLYIEDLNKNKDTFIRKSYRGGIVEIYKPYLTEGNHYDVNSLYPYIMKNCEMPVGKGQWTKNINLEDFFGFVKADIISPNTDKPSLPFFCEKNGLLSPVGSWTDIYFSEELKDAKKRGYQIKCHYGIKYEKGNLFESYISSLYNKRLENKKGSALNVTFKLLLNCLYGRFGMKDERLELKILTEDEFNTYGKLLEIRDISIQNNKYILRTTKKINNENLKILLYNNEISFQSYKKLKKDTKFIGTHVQIASAITSYARIFMNKYKFDKNLDIYYTDTDSIFCKNTLPQSEISETVLGKFRLENSIKLGIFLAPKIYFIENHNNSQILKCKGINNKYLDKSDYIKCFNTNNFIKKNILYNFLKNYKNFDINSSLKSITIEPKLLKREKIIENNTWINTKPIHIKEKKLGTLIPLKMNFLKKIFNITKDNILNTIKTLYNKIFNNEQYLTSICSISIITEKKITLLSYKFKNNIVINEKIIELLLNHVNDYIYKTFIKNNLDYYTITTNVNYIDTQTNIEITTLLKYDINCKTLFSIKNPNDTLIWKSAIKKTILNTQEHYQDTITKEITIKILNFK